LSYYSHTLHTFPTRRSSDLLFPDTPFLKIHKYQHIYMWLIYPLYTLNWLFIRDFKDFFGTKDNYLKRILKIPKIEYVKLFAAKIDRKSTRLNSSHVSISYGV